MKKETSAIVLKILSDNYSRIVDDCTTKYHAYYGARELLDIIHDAMITVSEDGRTKNMNEKEVLAHFMFRFRVIEFRVNHDELERLKTNNNANDREEETDKESEMY